MPNRQRFNSCRFNSEFRVLFSYQTVCVCLDMAALVSVTMEMCPTASVALDMQQTVAAQSLVSPVDNLTMDIALSDSIMVEVSPACNC